MTSPGPESWVLLLGRQHLGSAAHGARPHLHDSAVLAGARLRQGLFQLSYLLALPLEGQVEGAVLRGTRTPQQPLSVSSGSVPASVAVDHSRDGRQPHVPSLRAPPPCQRVHPHCRLPDERRRCHAARQLPCRAWWPAAACCGTGVDPGGPAWRDPPHPSPGSLPPAVRQPPLCINRNYMALEFLTRASDRRCGLLCTAVVVVLTRLCRLTIRTCAIAPVDPYKHCTRLLHLVTKN